MADNTLREAIRIVLETEGREGVDALRKSLASIGDVSADTVNDTDRLLSSLADLNETAAKAARFGELSKDLDSTTEALDSASRAALQLSLQLGETDKPSKDMLRNYRQVRDEVTRLESVQKQQAATVDRLGSELREQGLDTSSLATANRQLRTQIEGATTALQRQVGVVEREADAVRRHKQALAEEDAAFRKMVQSGHASAEALRQYHERADAAAAGTKRLAGEGGRLSNMFSGLRGIIAPVLGFLTLRSAGEGIKNLLGVGAAAESAKRSLGNLYGSQAQGNRVYAELKQLAKDNGQAFADVLDDAKKLKAFGLDPLNGSYQALVDQNAAVGGSQEDLSGKVLALGQAWAKQKLQGEEILQLVERGVPVWSLLEKATGKNVQQLQKLSEQGKLGRDVITALYQEIGKANNGAANAGLSGLTGLIAQATARWQDFLTKVADFGVTDYFKQQIASLLGSTGNLDNLARRVADGIIKTLDALKRLGQQIVTIASPIASATLALARHADAVIMLGKIYVGLKLTRYATQFLELAKAQAVATAATQAATAAEAGRAGGLGKLSGLMAGMPKQLTTALAVVGLDYTLNQFIRLNEALDYRREALAQVAGFERAEAELQQEQLSLGQRLQALYQGSADVVVQSGDRIKTMTRAQATEYQFALEQARQYFGGVIREARASGDAQREAAATERWRALGDAITAVKDRVKDLNSAASDASGFKLLAASAVDQFDKVLAKTKDAKKAISDIFVGVDFTQVDGLKQAISILDQVTARGTVAGRAVKEELRTALASVADEDLPRLKAAAAEAFGSGTAGAKLFAAEVDRINLTRLGVDVDAIKTGFTKAGRAAVDGFRGAIEEVDKLGLTAEQRSRAIAQAFDTAFKQAGTKAEVEALQKALTQALQSGDIGFQQFQQRMQQVSGKLGELAGSGKAMGIEIADAAETAGDAMGAMAARAADAADETSRAGDAARDAGEAAREGAGGVQEMAFSLGSMSEEAAKALQAQNRLASMPTLWAKGVNRITDELNQQRSALASENDLLDQQLSTLDPLSAQLEELRRQYNFVDDATLRSIAEKRSRLDQERQRSQDEQKRLAADAQRQTEREHALTQAEQGSPSTGTTPAPTAPAIRQSTGGVLATLRVQVVGGGTFDLEVEPASARSLLDELRWAQQVAQRK